ncbi:MAG: hypothetical protein GY845_03410 [Planctomycetes bacterium]|nr:hypothetical protein [Planctomycetota bacterium]
MAYKTTGIYEDLQNYFAITPEGASREWAGGTLTRQGDKAIHSSGFELKKSTTPFGLWTQARNTPVLYDQWQEKYGPAGFEKLYETRVGGSAEPDKTKSIPTLGDVTPAPSGPTPAAYAAPAPYVPDPTKLASGQMEMLMDKNSPYLQQAAKAGERTAQARGLLNTSMAAGAAQGAAMDRALPLAQSNAEIYAQTGLAGYQGQLDASLMSLQGMINSDLAYQDMVQSDYLTQRSLTLQGMISSGLSAQEAEQQLKNLEYQGLINAGLSAQQAQDKMDQIDASAAHALILDQKQQEGANYRAQIEQQLGYDQLASADRDSVSTAMTNYGLQFQKDILNIQMDKTTSGEEKTEKMLVAQTIYENNMDNVATLYGIDIDWDTPL